MLKPKLRVLVHGLPFATEDCVCERERAKNILLSKYGKDNEATNGHIQSLIPPPIITRSNPYKINEFYEKLFTHVQALDTMGKLKAIKGYVILILDKLPSRADDRQHD